MQSGQESNTPPQAANSLTIQPTAREILSGLKDADNPLDFIKNNLKVENSSPQPVEPETIIKEVEALRSAEDSSTPLTEEPKKEETLKEPLTEIKEPVSETVLEEPKEEEKIPGSNEAEELIKESLSNKEENFKNLRKKVAETANVLKEKEAALDELNKKIQAYETGEALPEALAKKEERIKELEKYERLHALKLSPAYKEAYVVPLDSIKQKLAELAADYEIPPEVIVEAVNLTSRRELNSFLAEHFDDVGALEVKELVTKAQKLLNDAKEAEDEPAKALSLLEQDYNARLETRRASSNAAIAEVSKLGWVDSLAQIRKEGKIVELIPRETDPDYNQKFVEPVLNAAASEYGKLIRLLSENGLESLPKDLAFALARMVHLAHASAISIESRALAEHEAEELKRNTARSTNYIRPPVGSSGMGGGGSSGADTLQPKNPSEAAELILNKVLARR